MSKNLFIGICAASFALLFVVGFRVYRPRIERDLATRTRQALESNAFKVKTTAFSGRDGEVRIGVPFMDGTVVDTARRVASTVYGVRVARVHAEEQRLRAPSLRVDRIGENIHLNGVFPNALEVESFLEEARKSFAGMNVSSELHFEDGVSNPPYLKEMSRFIQLLAETAPEGVVELSGNVLRLAGDVPDNEARESLSRKAGERVPGGLSLKLDLKPAIVDSIAQVKATETKPEPVVTSTPAPVRDFASEIGATRLLFQFNSTDLTPETMLQVEPLVEMLKEQESVSVKITGHADAKGKDSYNQRLSERRAKAVSKVFEQNGVVGKFETEGKGEREPLADNTTDEGRSQNRRVEFRILKR